MGCSGSLLKMQNINEESDQNENKSFTIVNSNVKKLVKSNKPDDLLIAFLYLEKGISDAENESPSSVYGEALSRQQQIRTLLQTALEDKNHNEFFSEKCSIYDLFNDLGLKNSKSAAEHEEFVARINRRALNHNSIAIWKDEFDSVEDRIVDATKKIKELQIAYQMQEDLLNKIFNKTYGSETEQLLEKQLDRMRYYKDMLLIGVLQWEACSKRIENAARLAKKGMSFWNLIGNEDLENKIKYTTTARDCFQEATILIQSSEELLQDVQFPYCTNRELRVVMQALEYIFTDILIKDRFLHATEVYENLSHRATLLDRWMNEILGTKLGKDFSEANENITHVEKELKNERISQIKTKLKLKNIPKVVEESETYSKRFTTSSVGTASKPDPEQVFNFPFNAESRLKFNMGQNIQKDENLKTYFDNLIENKNKTIWPSRRIDELQNIIVPRS